ncbi:MAG: hypothetical protein ACRD5L_01040, partial [Bryobacteraceae bacterium]
MEIQIQSPQSIYVSGETVRVDLTLRNTGPDAITVPVLGEPFSPQPYFVVSGPSFPKPLRVHWSGKPPAEGQPPLEVKGIPAGGSVTGEFTLPPNLAFSEPGAHDLLATYAWNGA